MEVAIFASLDAGATVDVPTLQTRSKFCPNSYFTFCKAIIKSSSCFDRINKLHQDCSYWQMLSLVCALKYHLKICFYPIDPKGRSKMASIVNKVYFQKRNSLKITVITFTRICQRHKYNRRREKPSVFV